MRSLFSLVAVAHFLSLNYASVVAFQTPLTRRVVGVGGSQPRVAVATVDNNQRRPQHRFPLHAVTEDNKNGNENETAASSSDDDSDKVSSNPFKQAYHLYTDYFDRLWSETDVDQRQKLAQRRAKDAILHVKNMVSSSGAGMGEEYLFNESESDGDSASAIVAAKDLPQDEQEGAVFADLDEDVRRKMEVACDLMLDQLREKGGEMKRKSTLPFGKKSPAAAAAAAAVVPSLEQSKVQSDASPSASTSSATSSTKEMMEVELSKALLEMSDSSAVATTTPSKETTTTKDKEVEPKKKKGGRSVLFGATMGLTVAAWVYSGNYIFTTLFTLMTALGQLEYYRMVMNAGIYPARRISVLGACAMFVTALFAPDLHQICLPVVSTVAMIWFLTMRRSITTISEIATTFTGMFYLGE